MDINAEYFAEVKRRYPDLEGTLECICLDLSADTEKLPHADLLIANLVVEYIGYEAFQRVVVSVDPDFISREKNPYPLPNGKKLLRMDYTSTSLAFISKDQTKRGGIE